MNPQHEMAFRDAAFDEAVGDAVFDAIVLHPDFAVNQVYVKEVPISAAAPCPTRPSSSCNAPACHRKSVYSRPFALILDQGVLFHSIYVK